MRMCPKCKRAVATGKVCRCAMEAQASLEKRVEKLEQIVGQLQRGLDSRMPADF
jgi:uncharacterized protein YceH (UPF0502 family)